MTFISCLYGRHISGKTIRQECVLINLLESGDVVMVDRVLIYSACLLQNGVKTIVSYKVLFQCLYMHSWR